MAQNVTVAGASYSDVPSVTLPKTGGGTASFTDVTNTTATASDVASGKWFHLASGERVQGTSAGGAVYQDADGYVVLSEDGWEGTPSGNISIAANGTYDVSDYAGATVAVPVGLTKEQLKYLIQRSIFFTSIEWPDGLTIIGGYAFAGCSYFNAASLPSTVTSIGTYAFYGCTRLSLTSLPSSVTSIDQYAFSGCANLTLTSLPSGITKIEAYAFNDCSRLALTSLPSGVTSINNNAFYNCIILPLSSLPSGVTVIGAYAFSYCYAITFSTLPSGVTSIGNYAFRCCEGMTSISCDGAITTLGSYVFNGSSSHPMQLTSASFPNLAPTSNLSTVFGSTTAANACQLLEFADIGKTTGIGSNSFANCLALDKLVLRRTGNICSLASTTAFTNTPLGSGGTGGTVYVPSALIATYQTATNWSTLYSAGTVTFSAIEGSDYDLS